MDLRVNWVALRVASRDVCSPMELLGFYTCARLAHADGHVPQDWVDAFADSRGEPVRLARALCNCGTWCRSAVGGYDILGGSWLWDLTGGDKSLLYSPSPLLPASLPPSPSPPVPPSTPTTISPAPPLAGLSDLGQLPSPSAAVVQDSLSAEICTGKTRAREAEPFLLEPVVLVPSAPSAESLQAVWNEGCGILPKWVAISPERRRVANLRLAELPDLDAWRKVVSAIVRSRFCNGQNERGWRADANYLLREKTWPDALDGLLDDRDLHRRVSPEQRRQLTRHANAVDLKKDTRVRGSRLNVVSLDDDQE